VRRLLDDPAMIVYDTARNVIAALGLGVTVPFVPACLLTARLGLARRLFWIGSALAISVPFILAVLDPDGSCDSSSGWCLFDITPGEWFVIGVVLAFPPWTGWALGVAAGRRVYRQKPHSMRPASTCISPRSRPSSPD
jgi:hypothetical protein